MVTHFNPIGFVVTQKKAKLRCYLLRSLMTTGLVFNIQRFSVHDGPGIRTTVFLKGCPMRCWWCHNPESQSTKPELLIQENLCLTCGACAEACPHFDFDPNNPSPAPIDNPRCTKCGACVEACPSGARQMIGKEMSVQELDKEILADRIFFDDSGGGVTFSGGEPLVQFEFLKAALQKCREREVHTAVDTCGHVAKKDLLAVAPLTDLFLFDIKHMDNRRHMDITGLPNTVILDNLKALSSVHKNIWIRVPVIPGVNDSLENMSATAELAASTAGVQRITLLPYHNTGVHKFKRTGKPYLLEEVRSPGTEHLKELAACFRERDLETWIGG